MAFDKTIAGRFRGNPYASRYNNVRAVDFDSPGTPLQDDATVDGTGGVIWEGITYTGKDGVSQYIPFSRVTIPDGAKDETDLDYAASAAGELALKRALLDVIGEHEVDPIITIVRTVQSWDIMHIGSGTLESVRLDGSDEAFSRGAIS